MSSDAGDSKAASAVADAKSTEVKHLRSCDVCRVAYIIGWCFRCTVCPDFDMCEACAAKKTHTAHHTLLLLREYELVPKHMRVVCADTGKPAIIAVKAKSLCCSKCKCETIAPRYKCMTCTAVELCKDCMPLHDSKHMMLILTTTAWVADRLCIQELPDPMDIVICNNGGGGSVQHESMR
jgi:hypothetical protein